MIDLSTELPAYLPYAGALLLAGGLFALVLRWARRWRRGRFSLRFQVLWDRKLTPHCPRCRTPLTDWGVHSSIKFEKQGPTMMRVPVSFGAYRCQPCAKQIRLVDEDGFELTPGQALGRLTPDRLKTEP